MKFSYDILPEKRSLMLRYEGRFTVADLIAGTQMVWADARYRREYDGIIDLTDPEAGVSLSDFRGLVNFLRGEHSTTKGRWAAVTSTPLAAACALMYKEAFAARHVMEVFSTWEAACQYLHLELPSDHPLPFVLKPR